LRKQTKRAMHAESECRDVLDYVRENYDIDDPKEDVQEKSEYRCRNEDCLNAGGFYGETGECDIIEAGVRGIAEAVTRFPTGKIICGI